MPLNDLKQRESGVLFEAHGLNSIPEARSANAIVTRQLLRAGITEEDPGKVNIVDVDNLVRIMEESRCVEVEYESGEELNMENEPDDVIAQLHFQILDAFRIHFFNADMKQIKDIFGYLNRIKLFVRMDREKFQEKVRRLNNPEHKDASNDMHSIIDVKLMVWKKS